MTDCHPAPRALLHSLALFTLFAGSCSHTAIPASEANTIVDENPIDGSTASDSNWLRPTRGIRGIFEDSRGNLWFTSPDWACKYDSSARTENNNGFTYFTNEWESSLGTGFQEDSEGRLWMQNARGIHSFDGARFTRLADRRFDARDQWAKADGDLWFGVDAGVEFNEEEGEFGVFRMHDGQCTFLSFPTPPPGERHRFYALTSKAMHGPDGMLWFGTFDAAFGFDGESFDIIGRERMGRGDDPRDIGIRGYHLDGDGNLWMADNGVGVYVYDGDEVHHFTAIHGLRQEDTEGNSLHRAFSIAEDVDGNFWFGTVYSGIWRYIPSESDPIGQGTFTNYAEAEGFLSQSVWTIYKTRSGELLFAAANPGAAYRFNGETFERAF